MWHFNISNALLAMHGILTSNDVITGIQWLVYYSKLLLKDEGVELKAQVLCILLCVINSNPLLSFKFC